jgi:hypothetical protein
MSEVFFSDEDVKRISEKFRESDLEKIRDFLREIEWFADTKGTYLNKNEILDLILGKPKSWEDFVQELDLSDWGLSDVELEDAIVVYEKDDLYVVEMESQFVDYHIRWIYYLKHIGGKGILIYWDDFDKVNHIGDIYVVIDLGGKRKFRYVPIAWFGTEEDAIKFVEK